MHALAFSIDGNTAQAWVIVIAAVGAAVVSVINAIKSKSNGAKLDVIHQLTNSNLSSVKADLVIALRDIGFLKEYISKNTAPPDPTIPTPEFIAKIEIAEPPLPASAPLTPRPPVPESPFPGSPFPPQPPKP